MTDLNELTAESLKAEAEQHIDVAKAMTKAMHETVVEEDFLPTDRYLRDLMVGVARARVGLVIVEALEAGNVTTLDRTSVKYLLAELKPHMADFLRVPETHHETLRVLNGYITELEEIERES